MGVPDFAPCSRGPARTLPDNAAERPLPAQGPRGPLVRGGERAWPRAAGPGSDALRARLQAPGGDGWRPALEPGSEAWMRVEKTLRVTGGHGQSLDSWPSEQSLSPLHLPAPRGDPLPIVKACILSPLLWEPANAARKRLTAGRVSGVSPMAQGAGGIGSPSLQAAGGTQGSRLRTPGCGTAAAGGSRPGGVCGDHVLGAGAGRSEQAFCLFVSGCICFASAREGSCAVLKRIW